MTFIRHPDDTRSDRIELFSSGGEVHVVKSPVRVRILSMLREREMGFDEIVARSARAKSTISVHLKELAGEGILDARPDPLDSRKKIFSLRPGYLGSLSADDRIDEDLGGFVLAALEREADPSSVFKAFFQAIRLSLMREGVMVDPILYSAGSSVGRALSGLVNAPDIETLLMNLCAFWGERGLGRLEVVSRDPLTLDIYDCYECQGLPQLGKPVCAFDAGILAALFEAHSRDEWVVTETKCYAMNDACCRFVVLPRAE
ncbi:hypothetical protein ABH15_02670 [Methanoculleus taiwanensis]|uniref:4-vinyl reductase n=2 Tax=Methanoculleus taiwanensis TaxID=1550565 RepID=A0A498H2N2_9EURY|nr:hypothetical protein ABH15_02670 [Methanoculleus taiwanensis]